MSLALAPAKRKYGLLAASLLVTVVIYAPALPKTYVIWDYSVYREVLESYDFAGAAWDLITDFKGIVVPGYWAPLGTGFLKFSRTFLTLFRRSSQIPPRLP
jgi:hypothetical protein